MKEKMIVPAWGYVFLFAAMLVPFLYVHAVTVQWNPFAVKGPLFVRFYGIYLGGSMVAILISRLLQFPPDFYVLLRWMFIFIFAIGLARLCQGIYHHKPVGYLVLMLVVEGVLWAMGKVVFHKKR
ncbi:hypothetical protein [Chitinophaga sp.]|uniref:hypothetical protein n=1 Tax=Chitinophaga sp. TaxID=1869181 RepID=UPI002F94DACA